MAELSESQIRLRERVETGIRLVSPVLNAVLAAGDRLSRMVQPEDYEYYPTRPLDSHDPAPGEAAERR